jgi:hypothetical protein
MGIINFGIPKKIVLDLCAAHSVTVFIETGTYQGATARWASQHFEQVHTIERSESLFEAHCRELSGLHGVAPYSGDSRDILPGIISELGDRRALYWLDSHWFGGETSGQDDQCPLLGELECLTNRSQDIILIDDARLFLAAPPMPHQPSQWPTIAEVILALSGGIKRPYVQIADDVIFVVPDEQPLKSLLTAYAKRRSNLFWQDYQKLHTKLV